MDVDRDSLALVRRTPGTTRPGAAAHKPRPVVAVLPAGDEPTVEPTNVFSPAELQAARERLTVGDGLHQLLAWIGGDEASDSRLPLAAPLTAPGFLADPGHESRQLPLGHVDCRIRDCDTEVGVGGPVQGR